MNWIDKLLGCLEWDITMFWEMKCVKNFLDFWVQKLLKVQIEASLNKKGKVGRSGSREKCSALASICKNKTWELQFRNAIVLGEKIFEISDVRKNRKIVVFYNNLGLWKDAGRFDCWVIEMNFSIWWVRKIPGLSSSGKKWSLLILYWYLGFENIK